MTRIVVVVDGARQHDRAMQWAMTQAGYLAPCDVDVVAVTPTESVVSVPPREPFFAWSGAPHAPTEPPYWMPEHQRHQSARQHVVHAEVDRALTSLDVPDDVHVRTEVLDHPHHTDRITRMADRADLVVVDADPAPEGRTLHAERLATNLLRHTATPVVMVS